MEEIYMELLVLFNDMRTLIYAVSKHNPGVEAIDKESLAALAVMMKRISNQLESLGIKTLDIYEERKKDGKF